MMSSRWETLRPNKDNKGKDTNQGRRKKNGDGVGNNSATWTNPQRSNRPMRPTSHFLSNESMYADEQLRQRRQPKLCRLRPDFSANSLPNTSFQPHPIFQTIQDQFSQIRNCGSVEDASLQSLQAILQEINGLDDKVKNDVFYSQLCLVLLKGLNAHIENKTFHELVIQQLDATLRDAIHKNIAIESTQDESVQALKTLSSYCHPFDGVSLMSRSACLHCLLLWVRTQIDQLPAELTAQTCVESIFLPHLDQQLQQLRETPLQPIETVHITCSVCETLHVMLQNRRHASALLAPLVEDVGMVDGSEKMVDNVIRAKLLHTTTKLLAAIEKQEENPPSNELDSLSIWLCRVLITATNCIRILHQQDLSAIITEGNSLLSELQPFLLSSLGRTARQDSETELRTAVLLLLRGLISCYSSGMDTVGWILLVEDFNKYFPLTFTSNEEHVRVASVTIEVLTDFVLALPWNRLLNEGCIAFSVYSSHKSFPILPASTKGQNRKAIGALTGLITAIRVAFQESDNDVALPEHELLRLLRALFVDIPYNDNIVLQASKHFWGVLVATVTDPSTSKSKQWIAFEALLAGTGGYTNPAGEMIGMCAAGQSWFLGDDQSSILFVERTIRSILVDDPNSKCNTKLLSAIVRTLPSVALRNWRSFRDLLKHLSTSRRNSDIDTCLKLLEAFMLGRKDFGDAQCYDAKTLLLACCIMEKTRYFLNSRHRCSVLMIYANFVRQDWHLLSKNEQVGYHFRRIILCCNDSSARIREVACKACGEFSTQFFGPISGGMHDSLERYEHLFAGEICSTMLPLFNDTNAGVRAMSIFAMGNLVNELRLRKIGKILDETSLVTISSAVLKGFQDKNDKVVGNAIRCIGHLGNLLGTSSAAQNVLVSMIQELAGKLSESLSVTLDGDWKTSRTWKQRSTAKKHGWGACHSLGLIYQDLPDARFDETTSVALKQLVLCMKHHNVVNQKIVVAAAEGICKIHSSTLISLGSNSKLIGELLTEAILLNSSSKPRIEHKGANNHFSLRKVYRGSETLLYLVLSVASISDAKLVLQDERISETQLQGLYHWMVLRNDDDSVIGNAFETFALAFSSLPRCWSNSIALELKFASQALHRCKYSDDISLVQEDGDEI